MLKFHIFDFVILKMKVLSFNEEKKDFFQAVMEVVKLIPYGRVTSYGAIAKYLGSASSSRMVGWAMNASHKFPNIPAHRVVNRNGILSGKHNFANENEMQKKLESEGIQVRSDKVVEFNVLFWDPSVEISL